MRKKLTVIVLVLAIILQLSVPVGMIVYSQDIEGALPKYGKEFKIMVYVQSIVDGSIDYRFYSYDLYDIGQYAVLEENAEGFANFGTVQKTKPKTPYYFRITMDNKAKFARFEIDSDITAYRVKETSAYLVIKAYKGEVEVVGLYMDDIPAKEWFETAVEVTDERGDVALQQRL